MDYKTLYEESQEKLQMGEAKWQAERSLLQREITILKTSSISHAAAFKVFCTQASQIDSLNVSNIALVTESEAHCSIIEKIYH